MYAFVNATSHFQTVLQARRNKKDLKVKPATSFKIFQYLLTKKIKTKFKAEKI